MLGCYVGPVGVAARGVPARFLNPDAPSETQQSEKKDGKENEEEPASAASGRPEDEMKTPEVFPIRLRQLLLVHQHLCQREAWIQWTLISHDKAPHTTRAVPI